MIRSNRPKQVWIVDDGLEEVYALYEGLAGRRSWYQSCIIRCVQVCQGGLHVTVVGGVLLEPVQSSSESRGPDL